MPNSATQFMDSSFTLQDLKRQVSQFRDARDWLKYDTPKNLAISISIEAAELLELFQWKTDSEVHELLKKKGDLDKVSDELADVIIYCMGLSDVLQIDVSKAVETKLRKNNEKYPSNKIGVIAKPAPTSLISRG